ncbi:hypothetical protein J4419_06525 [Candidatus Woesearchaeota archaeon]|nr:hypothetical protein [Candidatus Woesearchaeota archaeon]
MVPYLSAAVEATTRFVDSISSEPSNDALARALEKAEGWAVAGSLSKVEEAAREAATRAGVLDSQGRRELRARFQSLRKEAVAAHLPTQLMVLAYRRWESEPGYASPDYASAAWADTYLDSVRAQLRLTAAHLPSDPEALAEVGRAASAYLSARARELQDSDSWMPFTHALSSLPEMVGQYEPTLAPKVPQPSPARLRERKTPAAARALS